MINLLPTQEKEHLLFEEQKRMVVILASVIGVSLICLALLLVLVKIAVLKVGLVEETAAQSYRQEYKNPAYIAVKDTIVKANATFIQAENFYKRQVYFSEAIHFVSQIAKPAGVHIERIDMAQNAKKNTIDVTVAGTSDTRNDLLALRDAMNNFSWDLRKKLQNVNFPPESWTKPQNIPFEVTFNIPINDIKR